MKRNIEVEKTEHGSKVLVNGQPLNVGWSKGVLEDLVIHNLDIEAECIKLLNQILSTTDLSSEETQAVIDLFKLESK